MGTVFVAKLLPYGYRIGIVVTAHLIYPSIQKNLPFDTLKDLCGVSMLAVSPILIFATNSLPINNIKDMIALSRSQLCKLNYATLGIGTVMDMACELLNTVTHAELMHIPYNLAGDAYNDVFSVRVQLHIGTMFGSLPYIKSASMKPIELMNRHRSSFLTETPTASETLPGFHVGSMYGVVVPSGTPCEIVNKISMDLAKVLNSTGVKQRMIESGLIPVVSNPEEFDGYLQTEIPKWAKVVKASCATTD